MNTIELKHCNYIMSLINKNLGINLEVKFDGDYFVIYEDNLHTGQCFEYHETLISQVLYNLDDSGVI